MASQKLHKPASVRKVLSYFVQILSPEKGYYALALVYGIGIGVLSLSVPVSVQMLVNTVANTGLPTPLVVLSLTLFALLLAAAALNALRIHLMDMFQRRFFARMVAEIAIRGIYSQNPYFQDQRKFALFNRFFDIIIIQKMVPNLLIGGFTILLQAAVGFALTSMYHPLFLAYNLILILLIWVIWLGFGGPAIRSAVEVSHKKHATAAWLEDLGGSNGFFRSENQFAEALKGTDAVTANYITAHRKHFRHHFSQTICFLILYALASSVLLGLGGWLVIQGQLTLGQLIAAELVLSVVFAGLSQLGIYLTYFYEICGALDELHLFYEVEQETPSPVGEEFSGDGGIRLANASGEFRGRSVMMNFEIASGARVLGAEATPGLHHELSNWLKRHDVAKSGLVSIGGLDVLSIDSQDLRQQVIVLDRPGVIETTIREYLRISGDGCSSADLIKALQLTGLNAAVEQLKEGMETKIAPTGWPLTMAETMQLKLAAAIVAKPKILILGELYDTLNSAALKRSMDALQESYGTTILYFSTRLRDLGFTDFLYLSDQQQTMFDSFEGLCEATDSHACNDSGKLLTSNVVP